MKDTRRKAESLLKSADLRQTAPRIAVLTVLLKARKPQTADNIASKLDSTCPNKVTIYRTLDTFISAGLVCKVFLQNSTRHFELAHNCSANQCHPHFTCLTCGQTHCLMDIALPMPKSPHKGFVIQHKKVQLEGLCPKCSEKA